MTGEGKYIYSIIRESKEKSFGTTGINNQEVSLLHCKDIAAVVSPMPIINFDRLDKKELTRHVAAHQRVNEEVMSAKGGSASGGKDYDVVPMKFGIIAPSPEEVLRILEKAYLQFKIALKNIAGKTEFAVQVRWDPKKLLEELANTNPEIRKLKQKVALKGSILGMPMKLKLGKLIQKEAEIQRRTFIDDIHASLRNLSLDSTSNKLTDEEMIANLSFLIEKVKESELDKKMQELGKKYEGKLRFKYIGPMPPYSFVKINLSLGNFELVNRARKLLGLVEEATLDEIKKTYYALAHQYHPDKHQTEPEKVQNQIKKIIQAHSILENYCQSCDELAPHQNLVGGEGKVENRKYSFKEEDVKNSLIIK
ncbi:MAG: GvpL/GvpF family gas vesicle protein [Candidatus Doudnabacteria bacterium]